MSTNGARAGRSRVTVRGAAADLAVAVGAMGLAWAVVILFAFPYDDAFIHLRIARNLTEHGQPFWNVGEPVMGDSSPLWLLLLAGGFALLGPADYAFVGTVEAAIVAATALLAHRLLAGRGAGTAATAAAALLTATTLVPSAGGGMETPLAMLLLTSAVLATARGRWGLAGALLALGGTCRLELFAIAPVALGAAPRGRRPGLALSLGAVAGAEALGLLATYGTVLPNTVTAKSIVYQLTASEFLSQVPAPFGLPLWRSLGLLLLVAFSLAGLALLLGPLLWPRLRSTIAEHRALIILGALPAALAPVYAGVRAMMFPWYWPLVMFPLGLGLSLAAVRWPRVWAARSSAPRRRLALGALVVVAAAPAAAATMSAIQTARDVVAIAAGRLGRSDALVANARARTYLEIGADLDRRCPSGTVLAAEIGALGWTYRGRIIDGVGLVSPEVLPYHPLRIPEERVAGRVGAYPARAVVDLRPDLIVTMEVFNTDFARKAPSDPVLRRYAVVDVWPVFSAMLPEPDTARQLWASSHVLVLGDPTRCERGAFGPDR